MKPVWEREFQQTMSPQMQVCFLASNCKIEMHAGCASALVYLARLLCLTVNSNVFVAPIIVSQYYDKFLKQQIFLKDFLKFYPTIGDAYKSIVTDYGQQFFYYFKILRTAETAVLLLF